MRTVPPQLEPSPSNPNLSPSPSARPGRRPRVLIIAEAANPEWVSVPLVGWSHARALAEVADVHVVTQVRNRAAMERAGWREGKEFTSIDSESVAQPLWAFDQWLRRRTGLGWTTTTALAALPYYQFERLLWRRFEGALREGQFDLVHRLTPLSPTTPSLIAGRCRRAGIPFVLGPLNGGVPWPEAFSGCAATRASGSPMSARPTRRCPATEARARRPRPSSPDRAPPGISWPAITIAASTCRENGIDPARFPEALVARHEIVSACAPLRIAFAGRLVPYKGADILLEACAPLIRAGRAEVDLIGDGPQRAALEALVAREGLSSGVKMEGWVPHAQIAARLGKAEVFGFPSVREFGGGVVLEAMALGLVPVVADYAGPAELVTTETGYRVALPSRESLVAGLRAQLECLASRRGEPLRRMGARARRRVLNNFTWEAKAKQIAAVYDWVLGRAP